MYSSNLKIRSLRYSRISPEARIPPIFPQCEDRSSNYQSSPTATAPRIFLQCEDSFNIPQCGDPSNIPQSSPNARIPPIFQNIPQGEDSSNTPRMRGFTQYSPNAWILPIFLQYEHSPPNIHPMRGYRRYSSIFLQREDSSNLSARRGFLQYSSIAGIPPRFRQCDDPPSCSSNARIPSIFPINAPPTLGPPDISPMREFPQ
jgi:hypothetical protein